MLRDDRTIRKEIEALQRRIAELSRQQGQLEVLIELKERLLDLKVKGRK